MSLTNTKSVLAKLLASENISVQHGNVPTAYFDLKSRVLMCPTWVDMDGDLYDLVMGHEVGHALETPEQGWHNAVIDGQKKNFKSFLNVIEDARIEKKIKRRYPGLSRSFNNAYKELAERDFFGVKKLPNTDKLMLIDRINLRFKLGAHVIVQFNDTEREFVREIDNVETWEQVVDIAERVYAYSQEHEQDKINSMKDLQNAINEAMQDIAGDDEMDGDPTDDYDTSDADSDADSDGSEESSDDSEESEESESAGGGSAEDEEETGDDPQSITDKIFRNRESELVNSSGEVHMIELPEANLNKIIKINSRVLRDFETSLRATLNRKDNIYARNGVSYEQLVKTAVANFNKNNRKYISHILKEFEMRKSATQYARTQTAKTGELNMNALANYKFTNDIFKKISIVPKGKNHGMILFVDMSGSMQSILRNTIEQLLVLVSFCKLANIPFDVYGFSNDFHPGLEDAGLATGNKEKFTASGTGFDLRGSYFHLMHMIGSNLNKNAYTRSFNMLALVADQYMKASKTSYYCYDYNIDGNTWAMAGFGLNTTPTLETLLASRQIINDFRAASKADVVNVVYLTDGVGDNTWSIPVRSKFVNGVRKDPVVYIIDKKSKKKKRISNFSYGLQPDLTAFVRDITGCKHIGFYLVNRSALTREVRNVGGNFDDMKKMRECVRNNNFFSTATLGFDSYFYVGIDSTNIDDGKLAVTDKMTKAKIASEFKKFQRGKSSNRVLVSRFASEIAA